MTPLNSTDIHEKLKNFRVVPVVSLPSVQSGVLLSELLLRCGLPVVEITFRTESGAAGMMAISEKHPQLLLLAGTVLTVDQAELAIDSGAAAIVSPGFSLKMAQHCRRKGVSYFPGVCTPSEVQAAMDEDLDVLKFFPAEQAGGQKMISLFGTIYPNVRFMPTGGINTENIDSYLEHNNIICCGGTWLSPERMMAEGNWEEIENRVASVLEIVAS